MTAYTALSIASCGRNKWRWSDVVQQLDKMDSQCVCCWQGYTSDTGKTGDEHGGPPSVLTKACRDLQRQISSLTRLQSASVSRTSCAITAIHTAFDKLRTVYVVDVFVLLYCLHRYECLVIVYHRYSSMLVGSSLHVGESSWDFFVLWKWSNPFLGFWPIMTRHWKDSVY